MPLPHDSNPARGLTFVRYVKALAAAKGIKSAAAAFAQSQNWPNAKQIVESLKAAVSAEGSDDMVPPTPAEFDFAEYVRPLTILGKLVGLRRVPSRVRLIAATSGSSAFWSGERAPRPISRLTLAGETLSPLSTIAMSVVTMELLRSSAPGAEATIARDIANAAAQAMDETFVDVSNLGVADVRPPSVTATAIPIHSSGLTLANIDADLELLIQALADAGSDLISATFILRPRTALFLSLLRGSGGSLAHPGMTVRGGVLAGLPAVVSAASPSDVGSPQVGGSIVLLDPSQILLCDDGGSALEVGAQTSLQMTDAPNSGATTLVSLWQSSAVALKTRRRVNWKTCRPGMAQVLDRCDF